MSLYLLMVLVGLVVGGWVGHFISDYSYDRERADIWKYVDDLEIDIQEQRKLITKLDWRLLRKDK